MKTHKVLIIESERGWGQRIDDVQLFETEAAARAYCKEFNASNTETTVPDWYMRADYVGQVK